MNTPSTDWLRRVRCLAVFLLSGCAVADAQAVSGDAGVTWPPPWPPIGVNLGTRPAAGQGVEILRQRVFGDTGARYASWLAAWQAAGLRVLQTREASGHRSTVFDAPDGTRVFATLQGDLGYGPQATAWRYSRVASPVTLRSPCVTPPLVGYRVNVHTRGTGHDGEHRQNTIVWDQRTADVIDVDGDGELDTFVPTPGRSSCPEDTMWDVYVRRGGCGHRLGRVGPGTLPGMSETATVPLDPSGFRPLRITSTDSHIGAHGIPEQITTTRQFAVRNGAYTETSRTQRGGVCHHCATWSCARVPLPGTP